MERKILVYGNSDRSESGGFPTAGDFERYIRKDVFLNEYGRYRYTQSKNADVIVLSRDGLLHGHFEIEGKVTPDARDRTDYPPVKCVYLVRESAVYSKPVPMRSLGISGIQFGRYISEDIFQEIMTAAGEIT